MAALRKKDRIRIFKVQLPSGGSYKAARLPSFEFYNWPRSAASGSGESFSFEVNALDLGAKQYSRQHHAAEDRVRTREDRDSALGD
jgi:hypothetical protein